MINNNIAIKTISELLQYNFFIPSYQRGYRWTKQQVTDLLDDINEFSPKEIPNSNEKTWYCLQPVVVKEDKAKERWDVIDGQQRLTTIYLILYYLNQRYTEEGRTKLFELEYETRGGSANYLKNELGKKEEDKDNIDYFHMSIAYQTIKKWFGENKVEKSFEPKFYDSTKIIWYETTDSDSIDIFTRINSGKIPLTNAELIKALFLNSSNFANADSEKLRLKQLEIASEWDRIEYALQNDSFWYFINKNKNNLPTRIEFIFNLMSKTSSDDEYSTFRHFNNKFKNKSEEEIDKNWQEIKKYFQALEEWYNDRELYHKIGYLIAIEIDIEDILKAKKNKPKTAFRGWLNEKIQLNFKDVNLEKVEYKNDQLVRKILLLHNIQTMLNNENETNRFPFDRYKKESWDIEHIHAIATEVKVKKEDQVEWLKNNFVKTENHKDEDRNNHIEQIIQSGKTIDENNFKDIVDYVLGEEDNSLQNLCLLDSGTNRSYKNDSFKEKRNKIIEREIEGTFIPICTKNVFMKYYSKDIKDPKIWSKTDRSLYLKKIQDIIGQYLPQTEGSENE